MTEFLNIGRWTASISDQQLLIEQLKLTLHSKNNAMLDLANYGVVIEQASEPIQAEWETAWAAQTNRSLPILPSATLIWIDTNIDDTGGVYGTTPLSDGNVVRREGRYQSGGNVVNLTEEIGTAVTAVTTAIGVNPTQHPSVEFDLPVASDIILSYELNVVIASGSGTFGADFLVNGVKVGTRDLGLPTVTGIINGSASGRYAVTHLLANQPAGSYTVQAIFGVTGAPASPPALTYGGIAAGANNFGYRVLSVRAIAR